MGAGGVAYEDCFGDIFNVSSKCKIKSLSFPNSSSQIVFGNFANGCAGCVLHCQRRLRKFGCSIQ